MKRVYPFVGPRVMHGMGKMLAQAQDLNILGAKMVEKEPSPPLDKEAWLRKAIEPLSRRAVLAERKVANVQRTLEAFETQCEHVPADHPSRAVVALMIDTLRKVISAVDSPRTEA